MPDYLHAVQVDWNWPQLNYRERKLVRLHEARLQADPGTHTLRTLAEALAEASRGLAGRTIRALAEGDGGPWVLVARGGRCATAENEAFSAEGRFPEELTSDDFRLAGVTRILVPLYWPEEMLDALHARAAELDCSLSALVERAWRLAGSATPEGPTSLPTGGARRKGSVYLPVDIHEQLRAGAAREDRSMSMLVQRALAAAWDRLAPAAG